MKTASEPQITEYRVTFFVPNSASPHAIERATGRRCGVMNGHERIREVPTERLAQAYADILKECGATDIVIEGLSQQWVQVPGS